MATYYGTYGQKVQYLASDPSDPQIGQVWYNYTSATLKVRSATTTGTWASGGNMNQGVARAGQCGTQTAGLIAFGGNNPTPGTTAEKYDGTTWTNSGTAPTNKYGVAGAGTQTVALFFGGQIPPGGESPTQTNSFDGSTFSNLGTLPAGAIDPAGVGTQTAALMIGGNSQPGPFLNTTISFDGTSWTSLGGTLNTTRSFMGSAGIQTSALVFGGNTAPGYVASSESWNGTSWTNTPSLNTIRVAPTGGGTSTAALSSGGGLPPDSSSLASATELYNGTSWSNNPNGLSTPQGFAFGGVFGTQTAGIIAGGNGPGGFTATTQEFTGPGVAQTKTVTVS